MRPVPDDPNAGPEINGPRNPVTALGNEDDSLAPRFLKLVDGGLDGQAVICLAVTLCVEVLGCEINGSGVVEARGISGGRRTGNREEKRREQEQQRFHGVSLGKEYGTYVYGLPMRDPDFRYVSLSDCRVCGFH